MRFDAGAKVTLKFENFVYKFVFFGCFFYASLFATPMENARGTLFILLDGMAPKSEGLYNNYCLDYENKCKVVPIQRYLECWGSCCVHQKHDIVSK